MIITARPPSLSFMGHPIVVLEKPSSSLLIEHYGLIHFDYQAQIIGSSLASDLSSRL
jgi:hypothetical protein